MALPPWPGHTTAAFNLAADKALWAYPQRYRDVREAELLDLVRDLSVPGATTISWSTRWDLVKGGVGVRLRDRPPFRRRLAYHWLDLRQPPQWSAWIRDDIKGRTYLARRAGRMAAIYLMLMSAASVVVPFPVALVPGMLGMSAGAVASLGLRRKAVRQRELERHGVDDPERRLFAPPSVVWAWGVPARQQIWPLWLSLGVLSVAAAPMLAFIMAARSGVSSSFGGFIEVDVTPAWVVWVVLGSAGAVGLLLLAGLLARAQRRLAERGLEPAPVNRRLATRATCQVAVGCVAVTVLAALAAWAQFPPVLPGIAVSCLLGPLLIVGGVLARRVECDSGVVVTGHELVRAAFGRRPLTAPKPAWGLNLRPAKPYVTHTS